ncbi:tyrosine-type recombinase/integrase [Sphingomicrobium sp. XHP0239]|uniref:tyrosine-type recombinase/integrase n=1 Tax=Sphingomicrobium maritimum TaxID=3133972 RepID=UPI0031CC47C9
MLRVAYDEKLAFFIDQQRQTPRHADMHFTANRAFADYYHRCLELGSDQPLTQAEEEYLIARWGPKRVENLKAVIGLAEEGEEFINRRWVNGWLRELGFEPYEALARTLRRALFEPYRDACLDANASAQGFGPTSRFARPQSSPNMAPPASAFPTEQFVPEQPVATPMEPDQSSRDDPNLFDVAVLASKAKLKRKRWSAKTARQRRSLGSLFVLLMGDVPLSQINQRTISTFFEKRRLIVSKLSPLDPDEARLILSEIADGESEGIDEGAGPSTKTFNRDVTGISTLLAWAKGAGYTVPQIDLSILREPDTDRNTRARDERPSICRSDLETLFRLPTFTGSAAHAGGKGPGTLNRRFKAGRTIVHDFFYWIPILIWYWGLRREEACKLCPCDFVLDHEIPFVAIRVSHNGPIKNGASRRYLPLHPEMIRLGLIDFVREAQTRGYKALFPELRPTNKSESFGDQFLDLCWKHFRRRGGLSPDAEIHGIRHGFGASLKRARVFSEERADMLGHAGKSETDERYVNDAELIKMLDNIKLLPALTAHLEPAQLNMPIFRGHVPTLECSPIDTTNLERGW